MCGGGGGPPERPHPTGWNPAHLFWVGDGWKTWYVCETAMPPSYSFRITDQTRLPKERERKLYYNLHLYCMHSLIWMHYATLAIMFSLYTKPHYIIIPHDTSSIILCMQLASCGFVAVHWSCRQWTFQWTFQHWLLHSTAFMITRLFPPLWVGESDQWDYSHAPSTPNYNFWTQFWNPWQSIIIVYQLSC